MSIRYTATRGLVAATALSILIAGCGSSSVAPAVAPPVVVQPSNEVVVGVATPSSVAVVTATNAQ
jgi:hypothetical protein